MTLIISCRSTVIINITTVSLIYDNSIPEAYRFIMGFPSIVIMNIMASRIYRNVNSGVFRIRGVDGPSTIAEINFSGHGMREISLNGTRVNSCISGRTTVFELQKEIGSINFVGEKRV